MARLREIHTLRKKGAFQFWRWATFKGGVVRSCLEITRRRYRKTSEDLPALFLQQISDILYNRTNSAELVGKTGIYLRRKTVFEHSPPTLIRLFGPSLKWTNPRYLNVAMKCHLSFRETQIIPLIKKQTGASECERDGQLKKHVDPPPTARGNNTESSPRSNELMDALANRAGGEPRRR